MERQTSQKQIILDYLKSVKTHPSAETIYSAAQKKLPRISRGTVYRVLKNLKTKKEIQEIPSEVARYDGDISSHAHFICQKCSEISDVLNDCRECKILKTKKIKVGKIKNYQLTFYGYCKKCSKK